MIKNKKYPEYSGMNSPVWKGEKVGYFALHSWVVREIGKASKCVDCGSTKNVQWANKSHKYKRELDDWIQLCCKCHYKYDLNQRRFKAKLKLRENNRSGFTGVHFYKRVHKWVAYIWKNYKKIHLGYFESFEDAQQARLKAERIYW